MTALLTWESGELWHVAGWTMLHFLWLGSLVGLAAGAGRLVLRRASANVRYVAALVCLAVLAALPVAIAVWVGAKPQAARVAERLSHALPAELGPSAPGSAGGQTGAAHESGPIEIAPVNSVEPDFVSYPQSNPRQSRGLVDFSASIAEYLPWVWIVGTPLTFVLLATGVVGAERLRRASHAIKDGPIVEACARLVESLRIGRRVTVAVCERIAAPVLVGIVRPIILLPPAALTGWSPDEIEMVLLHELAHVRRWDNLINLVQRFVEALLFFHPAVWLVSNWVRREREACCDAVVVGRTNRPHAYAELLVNLAANLSEPSEPGRPRPRSNAFRRGRGRPGSLVSSAMAAGPLRTRIRRILQLEDDPMLISGKSLTVVMSGLLLAATLVVLNLPARSQAEESTEKIAEEKSVTDSGQAATISGLPSLDDPMFTEVPFVQGAARFSDGDKITIDEVRGTAKTFEPGNVYLIKGTYALGSHDRAKLAANNTAMDAAHGTSPSLSVQSTNVDRGQGTFTLFLPMSYWGWPHVSFYPTDGGEGFGGVYFGTGDSLLKNWSEVYGSDDTRSAESHAKVDRGKFPSLEDQKLADVIWRRMGGLELEPLDAESLKKVNALGYKGGLKNTNLNASSLQHDDILVGLHVWPTHSLQDVVNVLNRDDIAELNPLKYYVVRSGQYGGASVVTGRISVDLDRHRRELGPPRRDVSQSTAAPQPQATIPGAANQPTLRYDGKTFDQWRTAWRTELSTEKRLEAVKALAAFGANGYGKEAAEAIVEVAGQYDWKLWSYDGQQQVVNPLKLLLTYCIDAFGARYGMVASRIPKEEALSVLLANVDSPNPQARAFVVLALDDFRYDPRVAIALVKLSRDDDGFVRLSALRAMGRGWLQQPDEVSRPIVERIQEALRSDDREIQARALGALTAGASSGGFPPGRELPQVRYLPEVEPLLFSPNEEIRGLARRTISMIPPQDAPQVVDRLANILDDSQSADRLEAIRSLSAMGRKAAAAVPKLEQVVEKSENAQERVAAAIAIDRIEKGTRGRNLLMRKMGDAKDEKEQRQIMQMMNNEQQIQGQFQ